MSKEPEEEDEFEDFDDLLEGSSIRAPHVANVEELIPPEVRAELARRLGVELPTD